MRVWFFEGNRIGYDKKRMFIFNQYFDNQESKFINVVTLRFVLKRPPYSIIRWWFDNKYSSLLSSWRVLHHPHLSASRMCWFKQWINCPHCRSGKILINMGDIWCNDWGNARKALKCYSVHVIHKEIMTIGAESRQSNIYSS